MKYGELRIKVDHYLTEQRNALEKVKSKIRCTESTINTIVELRTMGIEVINNTQYNKLLEECANLKNDCHISSDKYRKDSKIINLIMNLSELNLDPDKIVDTLFKEGINIPEE